MIKRYLQNYMHDLDPDNTQLYQISRRYRCHWPKR